MGATDVVPDRLTAAKAAAIEALRELPTGGKVSVIAADRAARIVVNESTDLGRVRDAIEGIERHRHAAATWATPWSWPPSSPRDPGTPRSSSPPTRRWPRPPTGRVAAPVKVLPVGRDRKNQAIVALAVRTGAAPAVTRSVFISVANLDLERAPRRVEVWSGDRLLEVRDVTLEPQARADVDHRRPARRRAHRWRSAWPAPTRPRPHRADQLAADDRAWAVVPEQRDRD